MSALKNLLKSDTPSAPASSSNTAKLSGQGSHFPKGDDTSYAGAAQPSTVTGSEPSTAGPSDVSAAPAPTAQARDTAGPEAGAGEHVNTIPASDAPAATTTSGQTTGQSQREAGSAAIGSTTTYSTQHLASGDPTGSIVDHQSSDPLTYKQPEAGAHTSSTGDAGVPPSAASAAASLAWNKGSGERMPGEFPTSGYENPYKASQPLDPRVDGGKSIDNTTSSSSQAGTGLAAGVGAGAAAAGAASAFRSDSSQQATGSAPSTLTTTADPADRSAEYAKSTDLKGLPSDPPTDSSQQGQGIFDRVKSVLPSTGAFAGSSGQDTAEKQSTAADTTHQQDDSQQQGIISKAGLGIGAAASAAAAALGYGATKSAANEPHDTTAVATQPGKESVESGPPKHYRRESIPTTAYPAGDKSPAALAPPVGGTQGDQSSSTATTGSTIHDQTTLSTTQDESHTGRNVAAVGATSAALGAGAYGVSKAHEQSTQDTTLQTQTQTTPASAPLPDRTKDVPPTEAVAAAPARYDGQDAVPTSSTTAASSDAAARPQDEKEDHTARNVALGAGAGAVATGAGTHIMSQREKDEEAEAARKAAAEREKELSKQHEQQQKEAAKAEKEHQKEAEKAEKQHQKEVEKEQKQAQKEHEKAIKEQEKEEKKHQKELEKEEKKHQKEAEKEEKKHQKEMEKEEKEREAAALAAKKREEARAVAEEEDRMRRERETAAGVATAGAAGSAAVAGGMIHTNKERPGLHPGEPGYEEAARRASLNEPGETSQTAASGVAAASHQDTRASTDTKHTSKSHDKHEEKEKKPSIFKRIFKRRKNKDTGEDEEYSTDDEEDRARHAAAAGTGTTAVAGAGATETSATTDPVTTTSDTTAEPRRSIETKETGSSIPHHASEAKGRNVLGHAPRTSTEGESGLPSAATEPFGEITDHRR